MSLIEYIRREIDRLGEEPAVPPSNGCYHSSIIKFKTDKDIAYFFEQINDLNNHLCDHCLSKEERRSTIAIRTDALEIDGNRLSKEMIEDLKKSALAYIKTLNDAPWKECVGEDRDFFLSNISFRDYEDVFYCDIKYPKKGSKILETIAKMSHINVAILKGYESICGSYCPERIYICGETTTRVAFFEELSRNSSEFSVKFKNARSAIVPV